VGCIYGIAIVGLGAAHERADISLSAGIIFTIEPSGKEEENYVIVPGYADPGMNILDGLHHPG